MTPTDRPRDRSYRATMNARGNSALLTLGIVAVVIGLGLLTIYVFLPWLGVHIP
ncbi:MAG: hypothetical protein WB778_10275 [Thermoplasmata archaeon]